MNIGIIGFGHLGRAFAERIYQNGIAKSHIKITYQGSPHTKAYIQNHGWEESVCDLDGLIQESDFIYLMVRPQNYKRLRAKLAQYLRPEQYLVSVMAGISLDQLAKDCSARTYRMMCSGPESIIRGTGLLAIYPKEQQQQMSVRLLKQTEISINQEEDLDLFTVAICLPAVLLQLSHSFGEDTVQQAIDELLAHYQANDMIQKIICWAKQQIQEITQIDQQKAYITHMATSGGITESMVQTVRCVPSLTAAFTVGIARLNALKG